MRDTIGEGGCFTVTHLFRAGLEVVNHDEYPNDAYKNNEFHIAAHFPSVAVSAVAAVNITTVINIPVVVVTTAAANAVDFVAFIVAFQTTTRGTTASNTSNVRLLLLQLTECIGSVVVVLVAARLIAANYMAVGLTVAVTVAAMIIIEIYECVVVGATATVAYQRGIVVIDVVIVLIRIVLGAVITNTNNQQVLFI